MDVTWDAFTADEQRRLLRYEVVPVGRKRFRLCSACRQVVCVNKVLLGSLHPCALTRQEDDNAAHG